MLCIGHDESPANYPFPCVLLVFSRSLLYAPPQATGRLSRLVTRSGRSTPLSYTSLSSMLLLVCFHRLVHLRCPPSTPREPFAVLA